MTLPKYIGVLSVLSLFAMLPVASAHVVVKPSSVGTGSFQTFSIGVPGEKDVPTVGVRLVIPEGLEYVSPNVKPGWKITVMKEGAGESATVTEINWTGGSIPAGQRDDFVFSAKVPAQAESLVWKAYQTYQDGTVVSWDQAPATKGDDDDDSANVGPYSTTKIIDDLSSSSAGSSTDTWAMSISIVALALSVIAFVRRPKVQV